MAYIDSIFYAETYKGRPIAAEDFDRIAERASEEIDVLTMQRIQQSEWPGDFCDADQQLIKRATSIVAEWLSQEEALGAAGGALASSEKVGIYSYTLEASEINRARQAALLRATDVLLFTGLVYRGL